MRAPRSLLAKAICGLPLFAAAALLPASARGSIVVEFTEVEFPNLTLLDGSTAYSAYGLGFDDETYYKIDNRFEGNDDRGIATDEGVNNIGEVIFTTPVTTLTFDSLRINSDLTATVFDADGNNIGSVIFSGGTGDLRDSFTFEDLGAPIARMQFAGENGSVGIARLEYIQVPEPAGATAALVGMATITLRRRTRA